MHYQPPAYLAGNLQIHNLTGKLSSRSFTGDSHMHTFVLAAPHSTRAAVRPDCSQPAPHSNSTVYAAI